MRDEGRTKNTEMWEKMERKGESERKMVMTQISKAFSPHFFAFLTLIFLTLIFRAGKLEENRSCDLAHSDETGLLGKMGQWVLSAKLALNRQCKTATGLHCCANHMVTVQNHTDHFMRTECYYWVYTLFVTNMWDREGGKTCKYGAIIKIEHAVKQQSP